MIASGDGDIIVMIDGRLCFYKVLSYNNTLTHNFVNGKCIYCNLIGLIYSINEPMYAKFNLSCREVLIKNIIE